MPEALALDHLSHSSVMNFLGCAAQWEAKYLRGLRSPVTAAQLIGTAFHEAQAVNFRQKVRSRVNLPLDDILDAFSDAFHRPDRRRARDAEAVDAVDWQDTTLWQAKDQGIALLRAYYASKLANIQPLLVEERFETLIDLDDGTVVKFLGYLDIILDPKHPFHRYDDNMEARVVDFKTAGKPWSQTQVDRDLQPDAYGLLLDQEVTFLFHVVTKTKEPRTQALITRRSRGDLDFYVQLIRKVVAAVRSGVFPPDPTYVYCNRSCPVWASCRGRGKTG